jgi:hypothetical protein
MAAIVDLPDDLLRAIGDRLGVDGGWRSLDEVARDQAALAMAARCLRPLADVLARDIRAALGLGGEAGFLARQRPAVPCEHVCDVTNGSSMADVRAAAKACGIACARSRAETLERIREAVARRECLIEEREFQVARFDAADVYPPVPRSPVPHEMRDRTREVQRLTGSRAREAFGLTADDLRCVPALLKCNPVFKSAAPMRLFRVRDLRDAALRKHGSRDGLERYLGKRSIRSERMVRAASEARGSRYAKLERALSERGCEVRTDSRLCSMFLATGHGDLEEIADTMEEMKFCFEHTRYTEILDENIAAMREVGERYNMHEESSFARQMAIGEYLTNGGDVHLVPLHLR